MPKHIVIKVLKFKEKERILKSARRLRVCVGWGWGGCQIIVYVQENKTADFFSSNFTSQRVLTKYPQSAERKKNECIYNQNTLCGKVIIQNLSRDKVFPRVFPSGTVVKNLRQCRRHGFDPWSGKIPHSGQQLNLLAMITEPVLWSLEAMTTEPRCHSYWSQHAPKPRLCSKRIHNHEKPVHHNQCSSHSPREKAQIVRGRPSTAKNTQTRLLL